MSTRLALSTLLTLLAAPALAGDVSYELINDSSLTLQYFYTSPVSDPNWSDDFLGDNVLAPGQSGTVTLYGAGDVCDYDVRFVFEDGQELTDEVNVCKMASYTLQDNQ